jgi:hypothetical protein
LFGRHIWSEEREWSSDSGVIAVDIVCIAVDIVCIAMDIVCLAVIYILRTVYAVGDKFLGKKKMETKSF